MSPFIRVLLLVSSLFIVVVVHHPSEAGVVTTAKANSYDASNERGIKLLKDTLDKLQGFYNYIGRIITTLTASVTADGRSEYKKTKSDKKVEQQLESLAALHKVSDRVMDKVTDKVYALMNEITGDQYPGNGTNRVRRFVQSLHDNLQLAM